MTCYSCYKYLLLHLKRFVYRCFLMVKHMHCNRSVFHDPKCKKQEAGTNHIIYSLVATKIRFFQLFLCRMVYRHFICLMNLLSFFLL